MYFDDKILQSHKCNKVPHLGPLDAKSYSKGGLGGGGGEGGVRGVVDEACEATSQGAGPVSAKVVPNILPS